MVSEFFDVIWRPSQDMTIPLSFNCEMMFVIRNLCDCVWFWNKNRHELRGFLVVSYYNMISYLQPRVSSILGRVCIIFSLFLPLSIV